MANVVVGQSGGPSSVINNSLAGVYKRAKILGADKVYGVRHGIQGFLEERLVDMDQYLSDDRAFNLLRATPSSFLGSCRYKLPDFEINDAVYKRIFQILAKYQIEAFVYIGGNDSMDTIRKLADYGQKIGSSVTFVGAPKTIDDDLMETDHTPGYGSAAKYIATTTKEVIRDMVVYEHKPSVFVMEIMGRNAGWLTAASALSRGADCVGPDLIYLPEMNFDLASFREDVGRVLKRKDCVLVAVSEGIHTADGTFIPELQGADLAVDSFGHKAMGGTAEVLCKFCEKEFGVKTRSLELSVMQRCAAHLASRTDAEEAFSSGAAAVEAALRGQSGLMATLVRESNDPYVCSISLADVHKISNAERKVPRSMINEAGNDVTDEFISYARPLIMGELQPVMKDGVPQHLVLY